MNESLDQFVTGGVGNIAVTSSSGSVTAHNFYCFVVNEDCVVSSLQHNDAEGAVNVIDTYKLQGVTLKSGTLIRANDGNYFSQITLSSGSVIIYKR